MEQKKWTIIAAVVYAAMAASWVFFAERFLPLYVSSPAETSHWVMSVGLFNLSATFLVFHLGMHAFMRLRCNRCHAILEAANDGILVYDTCGDATVYVNSKTCQMYGYSANDFYRRGPLLGCLEEPPFSASDYQSHLAGAASGHAQQFEWQAQHRDGHTLWTEVSLQTVSLRGAPHLLAVVRDITGRKQVENTLQRLNRTLTMVAACGEVLVRAESEEELLKRVCAVIREVGGYRMAGILLADEERVETVRTAAEDFAPAGCPGAPGNRCRPAVAAMLEKLPYLIKDVRKELHCPSPEERECRHCSVLAVPLLSGSETLGALTVDAAEADSFDAEEVKLLVQVAGNISFGITSLRTAGERARIAGELVASERRMRELLEKVHLAAMTLDTEGTVTFCNDFLLALSGWSRDEVLGANWFDLFLPAEGREAARADFKEKLASGGVERHGDIPIMTRDGRRRTVAWDMSVLHGADNARTGVAGIGMDVTEHRIMEEQLRQSQKMEAVGQMAGGIAHDFNSFLTVISGYSEIMQSEISPDDPQAENVAQIAAAAERAGNLTRSLLAFSSKQVLEPQLDNLNRIVRDAEKFLRRMVGPRVTVTTVSRHERVMVFADGGQIEQILFNLATNARDAMPNGGTLTVETRLEVADGGALNAVLSVADTGCGMDEETRLKIFEPFFTTKGVNKGTGLGLAIVYGIVAQHAGSIEVASRPGQGTVFTIRIPARAEEIVERAARPEPVPPKGGNETVLVAEEDPAVRTLLERTLSGVGYTVLSVSECDAVIETLRGEGGTIALVLLDLEMAKKSGGELCRIMRREVPELKVLLSGSYGAEIDAGAELCVGEDGKAQLIRKPLKQQELLRKIREMLES